MRLDEALQCFTVNSILVVFQVPQSISFKLGYFPEHHVPKARIQ
ncbi:hypothetical protein Hanom_Chr12g01086441 [Helianthus anomalus]